MDPIRPPSWSGLAGVARRDVTPPEGIYFKMWAAATYETAAGVDPARVVVALSHTHAGLLVSRENADKPGGALIAPYLERLRGEAAAAAVEAVERAEPAVLEWEPGWCALAWSR